MNTPAELPAPKRSACARVYDSLHRHFGPEIRAEAELCICRRPWVGSLMLSSSAASAARNIGLEERKTAHGTDTPKPRAEHVTAPVLLLGKTIRLLPTPDGELRAADDEPPADAAAVQRYIAKAFGDHLDGARQAIDDLARRYEPAELNRSGFRLYEKFRSDVPYGTEGWGKRAVLDMEKIRAAT